MKEFWNNLFLVKPAPEPGWTVKRRELYYAWRIFMVFCAGLCMGLALLVLAVSTILNAIYFMKTVIRIYTPQREEVQYAVPPQHFGTRKVTLLALVVLNVAMGMLSQPIVSWIQAGLAMFG